MTVAEDGITPDPEHAYWYNIATGAIEQGLLSPAVDRVGPFATRHEAAHALDVLRANSEAWAAEDAADDR